MEWLSWKQKLAQVIMKEEMKGGGGRGPWCRDLQRDRQCVCVCVVCNSVCLLGVINICMLHSVCRYYLRYSWQKNPGRIITSTDQVTDWQLPPPPSVSPFYPFFLHPSSFSEFVPLWWLLLASCFTPFLHLLSPVSTPSFHPARRPLTEWQKQVSRQPSITNWERRREERRGGKTALWWNQEYRWDP